MDDPAMKFAFALDGLIRSRVKGHGGEEFARKCIGEIGESLAELTQREDNKGIVMDDLNNRMTLDQLEEWVSSGKDIKDAACGLMFEAARLAQDTRGMDSSLPVYLQLAQTCATLSIAEWLLELNLRTGK